MVAKVKKMFPGDRVVILDLFQQKVQSRHEMLSFPFPFRNTNPPFTYSACILTACSGKDYQVKSHWFYSFQEMRIFEAVIWSMLGNLNLICQDKFKSKDVLRYPSSMAITCMYQLEWYIPVHTYNNWYWCIYTQQLCTGIQRDTRDCWRLIMFQLQRWQTFHMFPHLPWHIFVVYFY